MLYNIVRRRIISLLKRSNSLSLSLTTISAILVVSVFLGATILYKDYNEGKIQLSYYDDIKDFNFDPSKKQIQFTMPFNWNITRLEDQKQLMVHQEVSIPKGSSLDSHSYTGVINGIDVTKNLMVDPSNSTKNVVHFMLPKPEVISHQPI